MLSQNPEPKTQNLLSIYLADLNQLTRPDRRRLAWYALIIFTPLIAVLTLHHLYGPSLARIMGW